MPRAVPPTSDYPNSLKKIYIVINLAIGTTQIKNRHVPLVNDAIDM